MGGRKMLPPSSDPVVQAKRERQRRSRANIAASASTTTTSSSSEQELEVKKKALELRTELAKILEKPLEHVIPIKCKNGLYDPIDALMIISDKDRNHSNEDLRTICDKWDDINEKLVRISFGGQGNHSNSKGCDLPTLVEIMMLSTSRKAAPIRRLAAKTLCRVLGGDESLANDILNIRRVQDSLKKAGNEAHPSRVFGRYVEQEQSSSNGDTTLASLRLQQQKRQIELDTEDMERRAKLRREEDERQAALKHEEDERQAAQKREADAHKKEELKKKHAVTMQDLNVQENKLTEAHKAFNIEKVAKHAENKARVDRMVLDGIVSREEAAKLLGESRVCISRHINICKILEKLWSGPNASVSKDLPKNLAQLFHEAYSSNKDQHFSKKPLGDFRADRDAPQNIWWYDTDLVDMWKFAEHLKIEEAKRKRNGTATLSFGGSYSVTPPPQRVCPTFEECRHKFDLFS